MGTWHFYQNAPGDSIGTNDSGIFGVHGITLVSGQVLWFSGHAEDGHYKRVAVEWDPLNKVNNNDPYSFPDRSKPAIRQHATLEDIDYFCCHLTHLPDGRILLLGGSTPFGRTFRRGVHVGTPPNTTIEFQYVSEEPTTSYGIKDILLFDPKKDIDGNGRGAFEKVGEMHESRWYPTLVNTPDGNILAFSGRSDEPATGNAGLISETVELIEVNKIDHRKPHYSPQIMSIITPPTAGDDYEEGAEHNRILPIYPGMQLSSNGKIYSVGPAWRHEYFQKDGYSPTDFSELDYFARQKPSCFEFDTRKKIGKWKIIEDVVSTNEEGSCILLHPASAGKILVAGGNTMKGRHTTPYIHLSAVPGINLSDSAKVRILDTLTSPESYDDLNLQMHLQRVNLNLVLLPDETVLIIGGHDDYKWLKHGHHQCELYNPNYVGDLLYAVNGNYASDPSYISDPLAYKANPSNFYPFKLLGISPHDPMNPHPENLRNGRTYHSTSNLLPDGSVIVAGGVDPDESELVQGNIPIILNQKTCEVYKPYYFNSTRPSITSVEGIQLANIAELELSYNQTFVINSSQAGTIDSVILMRLGAMTHHTDTQQRSVNIPINGTVGSTLTCKVPNDDELLPPGHYMLWIRINRVPCEKAAVLRVKQRMDDKGPKGGQGINLGEEMFKPFVLRGDYRYQETVVDGITVKLEIQEFDGTSVIASHLIDLMYFPGSKSWAASKLTFGRFATVDGLAEFIIDNELI